MNKLKKNESGFSAVEVVLVLVIVALLGVVGWFVYKNQNKTTPSTTTTTSTTPTKTTTTTAKPADPYAGWKSGSSTRAGFSFKYPSNWLYSNAIGDKDGVEHIELKTNKFVLRMDSFNGKDVANGGNPAIKCDDCKNTITTKIIQINKLGAINLETVQYSLDSGIGNALITRQQDGTYYVPSPDVPNQYTTFRGISVLGSLGEYQKETVQQFAANTDLQSAKLILQSVSY